MGSTVHHGAAAGCRYARRLFSCALLIAISGALTLAGSDAVSRVDVIERSGVYHVTAAFTVSASPQVVMAVLTDYGRIPEYVPDMEISKVIERTIGGAVVEQQAVSRFMLFSKRVHLLLEVQEDGGQLRFRDRCGKSFAVYDGSWTVSERDSLTVVEYRLNAKPMFEVPAFVLKRLLKRDAAQLIDRIKIEIAARP